MKQLPNILVPLYMGAFTLFSLTSAYAATSEIDKKSIQRGVKLAETSCFHYIHHDTFEYETCIVDLLRNQKKDTPYKLGMEYFGYVGALNSARMSMLGSDYSAWYFLKEYKKTQKKVKVNDQELCNIIPGDCNVRLAQTHLILTSKPPAYIDHR